MELLRVEAAALVAVGAEEEGAGDVGLGGGVAAAVAARRGAARVGAAGARELGGGVAVAVAAGAARVAGPSAHRGAGGGRRGRGRGGGVEVGGQR